jgi:hypothetical protein
METRTYAGHTYTRSGPGQPWTLSGPAPAAAPSGGGQIIGDPYAGQDQALKVRADTRAGNADARASEAAARAAQAADRQATNDAARLDIERARLALAEAGQSGAKITAKERSDAIAGYKSGQAVDRLVADLEGLYKAGPGATSSVAGLQDYLPLTINKRFDSAGNAARGDVGQALGFTGGQLNTATEASQSVGPYLPQAGDRDEVILDKINRLRRLSDDARSRSVQILGGVPDANGRVTPVSEAAPESQPTKAASAAPVAPVDTGVEGGLTAKPRADANFANAAGVKMAGKLAAAYRGGAGIEKLNSILAENGYQPFTDSAAIEKIKKREPLKFSPPQADDTRSSLSKAAAGLTTGGAGAYALSALDAASFGLIDEAAGGQTQLAKEYGAKQFPGATFAGGVTGALASSSLLGKGVQAATAVSPVARALLGTGARGALSADALYGAGLGAGESNDNRLTGALAGGASSVAGNLVGTGAARALGSTLKGVADPAVQYLTERGIPLSMGQTLGNRGVVGKTVNKLESLPVVGDMIGARRGDGIRAFNVAAVNDALAPIQKQVKGDAGQAIVGQAQDAVSQAYDDALSGVRVSADPQFMSELSGAMTRGRAVPVQGEQFGHLMDTRFAPLFGQGVTLDGAGTQAAFQAVRGAQSQFGKEGAMGGLVADELSNVDASIASLLSRQAPQTAEGLSNANAAYAGLQPINAASSAAVNAGDGAGIFTPAQLNRAVTANTKAYGGKAAAARGANQTDLMRYGQEVLPSTVPNSGTADRIAALLLPTALGGGAYGMSDVSPETAAILAALAAGSTKTGSKVIQNAMVRRPDWARDAGQAVLDRSRIAGLLAAPTGAVIASQ